VSMKHVGNACDDLIGQTTILEAVLITINDSGRVQGVIYTCVCVCVCIYIYVCVCVCVYVYTNIHTQMYINKISPFFNGCCFHIVFKVVNFIFVKKVSQSFQR